MSVSPTLTRPARQCRRALFPNFTSDRLPGDAAALPSDGEGDDPAEHEASPHERAMREALSHAAGEAAPNSDYRIVNRWIGDQLGSLFNRMNAVMEPTGTLLDNSISVFNNDCGDGNSHDHLSLPVIVAGGAGGKLMTGRHFVYPRNTPCAGLYVTLLNTMGVNVPTFGQKNSGPLRLA